jgi:hypothetical protein
LGYGGFIMTGDSGDDDNVIDDFMAGVEADQNADDADDESATDEEKVERKPKQADVLVAIAQAAALFHSPAPDNDAFAEISIGGHRETHRIRSRHFREWLRHQYFQRTGEACNSEALKVAVETIAAHAQFAAPEHDVFVRIAGIDQTIYIDLGDDTWRAVEVTANGWQIINAVPVRFIRAPSTRALPVPESGGSIQLFRPFCNLRRPPRKDQEGTAVDSDFVVLVGHILSMFRPNASYPVFVALGEHGSCKSTLAILIVRLTDPRAPEQRSPPKNEEDLLVSAKTAHVLPYDNFSHLPDWLSDAFCRLATGGGAGKRKLYTDDDEILFEGRRPILLTGIEDFVTRPDLVDRSNFFNLENVREKDRLTDSEIESRFRRDKGKIFGALLDGVVTALKNLPSINLTERPRMADFTMWAEAGTRTYWAKGSFTTAYRDSLAASVVLVIEASPVGSAVRRLMEKRNQWAGSAQRLLADLEPLIGEQAARAKGWPKQPHFLSGALKRVAPALRKTGIDVTWNREGRDRERVITIERRSVDGPDLASSASGGADTADTADTESRQCSGGVRDNDDLAYRIAQEVKDVDEGGNQLHFSFSSMTITGKSDLEAAYDELRWRAANDPRDITRLGSSL